MAITRGCGSRAAGGIYLAVRTGRNGKPLDYFTLCEPTHEIVGTNDARMPINIALQLTPKGVKLVERDGVYHVLDWIGSEHYPNVLDFWMEARAYGVSRRCELQPAGYAKLTKDSNLILLHSRAFIENVYAMPVDAALAAAYRCPKCDYDDGDRYRQLIPEAVRRPKSKCVGLAGHGSGYWWYDVAGDCAPDEGRGIARAIRRELPCGEKYYAFERPADWRPKYRVAAFAALPISGFELVDPEGAFTKKVEKLAGARLPVSVVAE